MKNQSAKANLTTKICIIVIVLLAIALIITFYFGFINSPTEKMQTSELVTLYYEPDNTLFYAYIEDGFLYYYNDIDRAFVSSSNVQKYEGLGSITRMETYNLGTGVNPVPFLITEEGRVYYIDYFTDDGIRVELYEGLADYEVADILSHSGEMSSVFELLLKDGTTQTVECENY